MKTLKQLDIIIQIILIILSIAFGIYSAYGHDVSKVVYGYFAVGTWQLTSALVHWAKKIISLKIPQEQTTKK